MAKNTLKWWQINTTGLYSVPQDCTHSSLLAFHGAMNTPRLLVRIARAPRKNSQQKQTSYAWHWNLIVHSCSFVFVRKLDFLSWAIRPFLSDPFTNKDHLMNPLQAKTYFLPTNMVLYLVDLVLLNSCTFLNTTHSIWIKVKLLMQYI